jgi:hypothetical protein
MMGADNTIIVGINDHLLLREGWHERTRDERCGVLYRPTDKEATFQMLLPGGDVEIVALLSASVSLSCGAIRGSLLYEGKNLGDFHLYTENWVIRRFPLPHAPSGWVKLVLVIHNPFVPNDVLENGDFRLMGLSVASLRVDRVFSQES